MYPILRTAGPHLAALIALAIGSASAHAAWPYPPGWGPGPAFAPPYVAPPARATAHIQRLGTADAYVLRVRLRGYQPGDISVTTEGDALVIEGRLAGSVERQAPNAYGYQRGSESFRRRMSLPRDADIEHLSRTDGEAEVLVTIPRTR